MVFCDVLWLDTTMVGFNALNTVTRKQLGIQIIEVIWKSAETVSIDRRHVKMICGFSMNAMIKKR